jgi:hypothetical protein
LHENIKFINLDIFEVVEKQFENQFPPGGGFDAK